MGQQLSLFRACRRARPEHVEGLVEHHPEALRARDNAGVGELVGSKR